MQAPDYLAQLRALVPPGRALCGESDPTFDALLDVTAQELARIGQRGETLLEEADPRTTTELLPEWERAFGLPDECSVGVTLLEARRAALLARITERRSPTPANIIALAAALGVDATIIEHQAHTTEHDTEDPVTDEEWVFVWDVLSPDLVVLERTTEDDTEVPLEVWQTAPHECIVRRLAPAHTLVRFGTYRASWDFSAGLPVGAALSRASTATHTDSRGMMVEDAADAARLDYDPSLSYNLVPNAWGDGGAIGGALPTGWAWSGTGLTGTLVGRGTLPDGLPYVDLELTGTATGASNINCTVVPMGVGAPIPITLGDDYSIDIGVEVLALSSSLGNTLTVRAMVGGASTFPNAGLTFGGIIPLGQPLARQRVTDSLDNVASYCATGGLLLQGHTVGDVVTVRVRISFPVITPGTAVYLADTVPLATLAERVGGVPQYGLRGLLVEAAGSNGARAARMDGAVLGSPGTPPANLPMTGTGGGLTREILASGTEDGWPYLDVRVWGVTNALTALDVWANTGALAQPVIPGETWSAWFRWRLLAGDLAGASFAGLTAWHYNGANGVIDQRSLAAMPTGAPLRQQRVSYTWQVTDPAAVRAVHRAGVTWPAGVTVDATLRIGGSQMQPGLGGSDILPAVGAPAVSTRAADQLTLAVADGTYAVEMVFRTLAPAGTAYATVATAVLGEGLHIPIPPAAAAAGERHLHSIKLRRTA